MTFHPHLAYSASAGSGKTFALAARYVALLFMGESPASILAATFTNKAAAEMRQRVVDSLRELGSESNRAFVEVIAEQTGMDRTALMARQPQVLARFLSSPNYIVTLDSFFASILRSSSLEIGLEPGFALKERDDREIEDRFLDELKANGLLQDLAKLALEIEDKRFNKILGLLHDLYTVDPLLPKPTLQNSPIRDIENEIEKCRHRLYDAVVASGASQSAIRNFAPATAKELSSKTVFDKDTLAEHRNYRKYLVSHPKIEELYQELRALIAKWMRVREAFVLEHLFKVYDHYRNTLISSAKSTGTLSFDDLSYFTYRLLQEIDEKEFLYFKLDSRFRHILLDEFQDTSTLQFLLLRPLIDEIFAGKGQNELRSFFYVGDTKQSLYRFRGGVEELFDKVAQNYEIPIKPMDTNYRSTRHVVEQVNRWFEGKMPGYSAQKPRPDADDGYVEVLQITDDTDDIATKLMEMTIDRVKLLNKKGINWDDIAILVHTNKDGQSIQEALYEAGIPTRLKTSSSLRHHPKIASIVAMIEYIYHGYPIDAEAMLSRIGESMGSIDLGRYNPFMSPLQMIDALVCDFGYFDDDPNILKLLEFAAGYDDIATFIEEFGRSSIEIAAHTVEGIQIMTIHGSKGLEFDHVVLLDRFTRPKSDTSALLFDYKDDLYIEHILLRTKKREAVDDYYSSVLEKQSTAARKDRLNLLYVALTRAAEGLTIIRKPKESIFDTIGIEPMKLGALKAEVTKDKPLPTTHYPLPTQHTVLSNYGYQEKPSQEEDEERDHEAILFGSALHYALEMMPSFEAPDIPTAINAMRNRYGAMLNDLQAADIERRINALIQHPEFRALTAGATIRKEQPITYNSEFKQIDLLLEYPDHSIIIDYKSSQKYTEKHRSQVRHYVEAIEKITGMRAEGIVVYLLQDEVKILKIS